MAIPLIHEAKLLHWQAEAAKAILQPGRYNPATDPIDKAIRLFAWAGGRGAGKSFFLCWVAVMLAMTRPGAVIGLCMDTYPRLRDVHLPILSKLANALGAKKTDNDFLFANGSKILMRYLDMAGNPQDAKSPIEGVEYHALLIDECQIVDPDYWLVFSIRARLSCKDVNGQECLPVIITSGVPQNTWWCAATQGQGGRVWRPKTSNNTYLPPGTEARLRAQMTAAQAASMLDAEDMVLEGAVFGEYRECLYPAGNLIDLPSPNYATVRTILAADLGIRHPHAIFAHEDLSLGAWIVTHEWAPDDVSIGELCRLIRKTAVPRREWKPGSGLIPIDVAVTDPAGLQRSDHDGRTGLDIWALPSPEGLGMMPKIERDPARRSIEEGVLRTNLALERKKLLFAKKLIEAGRSCAKDQRSVAKSMTGYTWDPKNPSRPKKDGFFDHGADVVRYFQREALWNINPVPNLYTGTTRVRDLSIVSDALSQARDNR